MKMKKLLQSMAFTAAFAAAFVIAGTVDASAATALTNGTTPVGNVSVDMKEQTLTFTKIQGASPKELLVGMGTANAKGAIKIATWDVYDLERDGTKVPAPITVDLSKLSNTKVNYVEIKTDDIDDPMVIQIPAVATKNTVTYNAQSNELTFKAGEADATTIEYRTAYSDWREVKGVSSGKATAFSEYQEQGATLYVRTPGAAADTELVKYTGQTTLTDATSKKELSNVYVSGSLPGKEVKLAIAKKANGPKVTVDYTKAVLTFAKGTEYRILETGTATTPSDPNGYKNAPVSTFLSAPSGVLEVRTAAVVNNDAPKKAKAASKWTRVDVETPAEVANVSKDMNADTAEKPIEGNDEKVTVGGGGIANAYVGTSKEAATVTAEYVVKSNKYASVKLTNKSNIVYQISVISGDVTDPEKGKIFTLKAVKGETPGTVSIDKKVAVKGAKVYIREAGVKADQKWVGAYTEFGLVDPVEEKTKTPVGGGDTPVDPQP